jgi:alpha-galactosidase/6-phospho-beta-glucosidase family protein
MKEVREERATGLKLAYIGGGSRGWAWKLMSDLAMESALEGTVSLYDLNREAAQDNALIGGKISALPESKSRWRYEVAADLKSALTGADFVAISIVPGTFEEMRSDVHAPEKYGIYQSVGDSTGPGGLMRALRTIPIYAEFAAAIAEHCPDAWVINYTNPMTLCTRTLHAVFPGIKAFGCCHEVFGTQKVLAEMIQDMLGLPTPPREEIKVNVLGINHFTWHDKASWRGIDLIPVYRDFVEKYAESGYHLKQLENWMSTSPLFRSPHRVKFDLFRRYGIIASAGDRHLAEFMPPWYLKDPETVAAWKFALTPVSYRIEHKAKLEEQGVRLASGAEPVKIALSGEEGVRQMKALLGLGDLVTNVNIPNRGQLEGAPLGAVVETNAVFSRDSLQPVYAGALPPGLNGLMLRHIHNHETILRAALTRDAELAFQAFVNDPLVTIGVDDARKLFLEMLRNTKKYLPGWKI